MSVCSNGSSGTQVAYGLPTRPSVSACPPAVVAQAVAGSGVDGVKKHFMVFCLAFEWL